LNPGVLRNGLFWTAEIPRDAVTVHPHARLARLRLRNQPLVETFQFGAAVSIVGHVDVDVLWRATSDPVSRGSGRDVDPTSPAAFRALFADARCIGKASAIEADFAFQTRLLTADDYFAEMGLERNGVFLG
jgi:hypothetical protein